MLTTDALLEELGVGDVPRILVEQGRPARVDGAVALGRRGNACACARGRPRPWARASGARRPHDAPPARPLVEAIATALRERWENAAKPPPVRDDLPVREMLPWETQPPESADTLDALLLAAGRRRKHAP